MYRTLYPFNVQQKHSVARQKAAKFYGCTTSTVSMPRSTAFSRSRLPRKLYEGPCPIDLPQLCTVHLAQGGATAMHNTIAIARLNFPVDWFIHGIVVASIINLSSKLECHDQLNYYTDCAPLSSRRSFPDHIVGSGDDRPDMNVQYLNTAVAQRSAIRRTDTKKHSCLNARATWHDRCLILCLDCLEDSYSWGAGVSWVLRL
ncbi:hypothetical protein DFH09DRAFT_1080688 [Mycena vulgaris]|nr:hypothetical protein DFH09DRAFT_1080688 [Mycena vulgaris]